MLVRERHEPDVVGHRDVRAEAIAAPPAEYSVLVEVPLGSQAEVIGRDVLPKFNDELINFINDKSFVKDFKRTATKEFVA